MATDKIIYKVRIPASYSLDREYRVETVVVSETDKTYWTRDRIAAFNYNHKILKDDREAMRIGLDPIEAIHLEMQHWQEEVASLKERLLQAERHVTECAVLGMAAANVGAKP
jgi:hypothetical protein